MESQTIRRLQAENAELKAKMGASTEEKFQDAQEEAENKEKMEITEKVIELKAPTTTFWV